MKTKEYLSLWDAVLINLNVMFGTGLLINTVTIAQKVGFLGFFSYFSVAMLMLPLIYAMMFIVKKYPSGGFYQYAAKDLGVWAGFVSSWIYFTGKLASATLLVHVFSVTLLSLWGHLYAAKFVFVLDVFIFLFFLWLNHFNLKTGTKVTYIFIALKFIPVLFITMSGLYLCNIWSFSIPDMSWERVPTTISLILYAFVGFEAACSLSGSIIDSERNAPRAILYSFGIVALTTTVYQFIAFMTIGPSLTQQDSFLSIFSNILDKLLLQDHFFKPYVLMAFYVAIACSALGGSYGILLSNAWNLHTLSKRGYTVFASSLKKLNRYGVPFGCIVVEILICIFYLLLTQGNFIALQQISVLCCTVAYAISIFAFLISSNKMILSLAALCSCSILLTTCLQNLIVLDIRYFVMLLFVVIIGITMFLIKKRFVHVE